MIQNGGIITIKEADANYLLRYLMASSKSDNPTIPWQTTICPECGDIPTPDRLGGLSGTSPYTHILDDDGYVLIGCEGYFVINPAVLGITSNWSDWTEEIGQI
jgi:hypothetical protein